jgi:hypothetical protein
VQTAVLPFDEAADAPPTAGFKPAFVRDPEISSLELLTGKNV